MLQEFFVRHCRPNLRGGKAVESLLRRKVLPHWKGRPLNAIARIDCIRLLDLTVDKDGAAQGTEVRRHLSGFLSWAANRGYIQSNPLAGARLPELTPKSRSRVLDEKEIQAVWAAVLSLEQPYRAYVQLLFLTAGRRTEIANLRTSWFGIVEGEEVIDIPGAYTKTGEPHVLPITTAIRSVLDSCPVMLRGDCVFSTTQGEKPISGFSKILTPLRERSKVDDWGFHDIRRTVATELARQGVSQEWIERVLAHKIPGVAGTYNKYSYLKEKRTALEQWGVEMDGVMLFNKFNSVIAS
ncbi:MAG: tyrosine-type recombinase/integrase [Sphingopyxis sp.]|nr:tyrosine-type recombinase/integrase [Sphingopyxis sp.]